MFFEIFDHVRDAAGRGRAGKGSRVHHFAGLDVGLREGVGRQLPALGLDDDPDVDAVFLGELEVPLVVGRYGHDGPRAVLHEGVVGDPERHFLAVYGVDDVGPREDALLLDGLVAADGGPLALHAVAERQDLLLPLGAGNEVGDEGVLRRQAHERNAPERVGPGRETRHGRAAGEGEIDACALAAADPVGLHRADLFGPVAQFRQVIEQPLGVLGNPEEPLVQVLQADLGPASLAAAVHDLLVRQARLARRAPVHRRLLAVRQAALVEDQEDPLGPLVVVGGGGVDLPPPVVPEAPSAELVLHVRHVVADPGGGQDAGVDGGVLGRQTEGVEPHRREHLVATHHLVAGHDVTHDVVAAVTDVQHAAGVREHGQAVELPVGRGVAVGLEGVVLVPPLLPLLLDLFGVVVVHGRSSCVVGGGPTRRLTRVLLNEKGLGFTPRPLHSCCARTGPGIYRARTRAGFSRFHLMAWGVSAWGVGVSRQNGRRTRGAAIVTRRRQRTIC